MSADRHTDLEALRDDLAAYALGALDETEAAELERHLGECEGCRERLQWLRPATDMLAMGVDQVEPPARLRDELMAAVRAEAVAEAAAPAAPPAARRTTGFEAPLWRRLLWRPATAVAAVVLLVAGAGAGYLLRGDEEGGAPPSEFIEAQALTGARAAATLERHGDSATLHVHDLPALREDRVYEVWVQRAGVMEPSSTFLLSQDHSAAAAIPGPLTGAKAIYVTEEPRGGSRSPTSEPLLTASLN